MDNIMWHPACVTPRPNSKIVALFQDGSGAEMMWCGADGYLDGEGNRTEDLDSDLFVCWAYLPDNYSFWCETLDKDAVELARPIKDSAP